MISSVMHVRAISGPVNESCRLSRSDANCTRPLKSSLPSVLVYLPPQQKKKIGERDKGREKCCTQAETIIKPRTLLCQRGEREDKPSLCVSPLPPLPVSLSLTLSETGHILKCPCGKGIGGKRWWQLFNAASYRKQYSWTRIENHFVTSHLAELSLLYIK